MRKKNNIPDYAALAEFRYRIRLFLTASEKAARDAGIEPEQYQLLLAVRRIPANRQPTIQMLAERLQVRHNTMVERVDRMCNMGLLRRSRNAEDHRAVNVELTARGLRKFEKLATQRLHEMRESGPELVHALNRVVTAARKIATRRS